LQSQLQLAVDALGELEGPVEAARVEAEKTSKALSRLIAEQQDQTGHILAPHVDALTAAAAEEAGMRQRLVTMRQIEAGVLRLEEQQQEIEELREQQQQLRGGLDPHAGVGIYRRDMVTAALSEAFAEIIADIGLPNATGRARIDADTLLPWVDEQPFHARGGGARVAVAVAYSLALLGFTLEDALSTLPGLLMIDSPSKNLGRNDSDQKLARRVYERFIDAMQTRGAIGDGRYERPFQLIIVDNDRPDVKDLNIVHEFTYDSGFIKNIKSPHGIPEKDVELPFSD
jgi:hypothetical protein